MKIFAYVTNKDTDDVSVIATSTNTVDATISLAAGAAPLGIAITPDGVANSNSNNVSIIATANNTVVGGPIGVGIFPIAVAITPDGKFVYIANFFSNDVTIISTASNTVIGSPIPVGTTPFGIAIASASLNMVGRSKKDIFLNETERFNVIKWSAPGIGIPTQY